jgi:U3 small nucleolar RNA-associated protein 22
MLTSLLVDICPQKRNFVMNKVAKHLSKHSKKLGTIDYKWAKGSGRAPYLQLVPNLPSSNHHKKSPKFQVHLHFGVKSMDWIPPLRLVPNRCNLKQLDESDDHATISLSERAKTVDSQLYNQSLLYDARHQFEEPHLSALAEFSNVESTLVLIQIWALKRGLLRNHDGWSMENVAIFLLYLLRTNRMNPRMSPIQQLTVVMQIWATSDWLGTGAASTLSDDEHQKARGSVSQATQFAKLGKGARRQVLVLPTEDTSEKETIRQSELARLYEQQTKDSPLTDNDAPTLIEAYACLDHYRLGPVMLDPTMTYNYLGDVSPNYMKLLQHHAGTSLKGLKTTRSSFAYMFMENARFWNQWDMYVQIPVIKSKDTEWEPAVRALLEKLELALGDRISGMRVMSTGNGDVCVDSENLDYIPGDDVKNGSTGKQPVFLSPIGTKKIVVGFSVNSEASQRVVDRGPPSDHSAEAKAFVDLWGEKAQLRRFKDGAIVQAVVWNDDEAISVYQNKEKLQGGYVEKIIRHVVRLHYTRETLNFALPNLLSIVDGMKNERCPVDATTDPVLAHHQVLKAYESLAQLLQENSQPIQMNRQHSSLGLPLAIDAVEPLSPCLRYSELFPPVPHPFLGSASYESKKVSGALMSDPVLVQIRFGASSKWPSDLKAIGAAKTAMLVQLANGIENLNEKCFDGPAVVTPSYLDLGYKGYCFRIIVRADPEIKMLQGLVRPSPAASALLKDLTRIHVTAAKHHSMMHAVHTLHPSSSAVVRAAKRWIANHLLSGLITTETIELMVAKVYSAEDKPIDVPATVTSGFLRFLHLLAFHDWFG